MREGREPKVSRAIIAAMADVGPDGITMQELVARSNSTQKSLRTLLSRLRERGHPFWVVRDAAGVRVKIMHAHERPMQHLPLIIKRLADAGDAGVSRDDLSAGIPKLSFNRSKSRCAKEGSLFASVRRGLGDQVRYFGSAAARDAYAASRPARVKAVKVKAVKPPKVKAAKPARLVKPPKEPKPVKLAASKPKPPTRPAFADQPADWSRAVWTRCESKQDERYTANVGPGHKSALDPRQCRPWAMAAVGVAA